MNHGYQVESPTNRLLRSSYARFHARGIHLDGYVHMDCEVDYAHSRCPAQLCFLSDTNSRI